jgi:hypothetical protein
MCVHWRKGLMYVCALAERVKGRVFALTERVKGLRGVCVP